MGRWIFSFCQLMGLAWQKLSDAGLDSSKLRLSDFSYISSSLLPVGWQAVACSKEIGSNLCFSSPGRQYVVLIISDLNLWYL